jgi:hypothetical protein
MTVNNERSRALVRRPTLRVLRRVGASHFEVEPDIGMEDAMALEGSARIRGIGGAAHPFTRPRRASAIPSFDLARDAFDEVVEHGADGAAAAERLFVRVREHLHRRHLRLGKDASKPLPPKLLGSDPRR